MVWDFTIRKKGERRREERREGGGKKERRKGGWEEVRKENFPDIVDFFLCFSVFHFSYCGLLFNFPVALTWLSKHED